MLARLVVEEDLAQRRVEGHPLTTLVVEQAHPPDASVAAQFGHDAGRITRHADRRVSPGRDDPQASRVRTAADGEVGRAIRNGTPVS